MPAERTGFGVKGLEAGVLRAPARTQNGLKLALGAAHLHPGIQLRVDGEDRSIGQHGANHIDPGARPQALDTLPAHCGRHYAEQTLPRLRHTLRMRGLEL